MTPANTAYTPTELAHQLTDSGAYHILLHPSLLPVALQTLELLKVSPEEAKKRIVIMGLKGETAYSSELDAGGWIRMEDLLNKGRLEKEEPFEGPLAEEVAALCYSSGTTGLSKGVMVSPIPQHDQRNMWFKSFS